MAKANVLVVDDEVAFAELLAERLKTRDFNTAIADGGQKAIEMVQKRKFDAVVLDLAMPGMDGIETLKELLKIDKNLQVIFLTGQATVDKGIEAVKLGAVDFLEKPSDIDTIVGKVTEAQEKRLDLFEEELDKKMSDIMHKKGW